MTLLVGAAEGKGSIVTSARALAWTKETVENATKMGKLALGHYNLKFHAKK